MTQTVKHTTTVLSSEEGLRLDRFLALRFTYCNREVWQQRIRNRDVLVDGNGVRPSVRIRAGQTIEFFFHKKEEPPVNTGYSILYEDRSLLVIDKPPNLPVHPSGIYFENTLYMLLKQRVGDDASIHFVHRLDRETSGVLVIAKDGKVAAKLQRLFFSSNVYKEYAVAVFGRFPESLDATGILLQDDASDVRKKRKFILNGDCGKFTDPSCQSAITGFSLLVTEENRSLVRAILQTGRTHQIRATLCSLGFPVIGDRLYGIDDTLYLGFINDTETEEDRKRLGLGRTALHCRVMEFEHPDSKEMVRFESKIPDDIGALFSAGNPTAQ